MEAPDAGSEVRPDTSGPGRVGRGPIN
jgi:hypothetical protein